MPLLQASKYITLAIIRNLYTHNLYVYVYVHTQTHRPTVLLKLWSY